MAPLIEFIHVLCGVSFFGLFVSSFVYVYSSIRQQDALLLRYAIKNSLLVDVVIFPVILIQLLTGTWMVHYHHLALNTPWIIVAYCSFCVVSLLWFVLFLIKSSYYCGEVHRHFRFKKTFITLNIIVILLFCMIVHDAVMQQTWLWR